METIANGESGLTIRNKLNALVEPCFNVKYYGAIGNGIANDTAAIQAAIDAAHVTGGTVYFPVGVYMSNTLTLYENINLKGDRVINASLYSVSSVVRSRAAETLMSITGNTVKNIGYISDLTLDGNNLGTIGIDTEKCYSFYYHRINIINFKTYGVKLLGSLLGTFESCRIINNVTGVYAIRDTSGGVSAPNLIVFRECFILSNTIYGIDCRYGSSLKIESCVFEQNGTNSNYYTGCINYYGCYASDATGLWVKGLILRDSWFESNYGVCVTIQESAAGKKQLSVIDHCLFAKYNKNPLADVWVIGAAAFNKVILRDCILHDTASIIFNGTYSRLTNVRSAVEGSIIFGNGALASQYHNLFDTEDNIMTLQKTGAFTDNTPTADEINTITGLTPATAGVGWKTVIKDSNGSGLCYLIESDGTAWHYWVSTIAS